MPCGLDVPSFPMEGQFHWEFYVPIDEEHHMYFILNGAQVKNDEDRDAFYKSHASLSKDLWKDPASVTADNPEGFNNACLDEKSFSMPIKMKTSGKTKPCTRQITPS